MQPRQPSDAASASDAPQLRCLLESFDVWLAQQEDALPVELGRSVTKGRIDVTLDGVNRALRVSVEPIGVTVVAHWHGTVWDMLLSEDLAPVKNASGWHCGICMSSGRTEVFHSLEALYADHLFRPLGNWLAHTLGPATHLVLWRTPAGSKWASLVNADPSTSAASTVAVLPLRRRRGRDD